MKVDPRSDETMIGEASRVLQVRAVLLADLRAGVLRPGQAINVKETASSLRLSGTPVREALERLAGEGLVTTSDRHGFAANRLRPRELVGYHELLALLVEDAIRGSAPIPPSARSAAYDHDAAAEANEAVFDRILGSKRSRAVAEQTKRIANILAPYRRVEPKIIPGWADELGRLAEAAQRPQLLTAMRAITRSRRALAADIVDAAEL